MRSVLLVFVPALLLAQDPREIIRRTVELDQKNAEIARNYTYLQREEERQLDGANKIKSRKIRTFDVTPMEGSPYRRLVARDDKPLSAAEEQDELQKLAASNEARRKETPEQRNKRMAEAHRREERRREPLKELLDAFHFTLAGSEKLNGFDTWVIDATPRPGFKPRTSSGQILAKLKARFWVEKSQYRWAKVDAETLDTVTFGAFVVRLSKGSHIIGEQIKVNDEVWLPRSWSVEAAGRILLVKSLRIHYLYSFSGYKKFSAESRIVSTAEK